MTLTLNRLIAAVFVTLSLLTVLFISSPLAHAQGSAKNSACEVIGEVSGGAADNNCNPPAGRGLEGLIKAVVNLISIIAGIIAVIAIMIAGVKYVTSQGDAAQVASAKRALIYAIVGIIVAGSAQVIVRYVLGRAT